MMNGIKTTAILLAAGRGSRMGRKENKVYMDLAGIPMILYPLQAFEDSEVDEVIVIASEKEVEYVQKEIIGKYGFSKVISVIAGGKERYESVYFGLSEAKKLADQEERYVLIQDGARAFLTEEQVNYCIEEVAKHKACVMGMPTKDTIRVVDEDGYGVKTLDRSTLWIVQTPQCFLLSEILQAFDKMREAGDQDITDDAMVLERYGNRKVKMIPGGYDNIKVTTPEDIPMGEAILKKRAHPEEKGKRD